MSALTWNPGPAVAAMRREAAAALNDAGEFLLEEANRTVPIEEGTLGRSGQVTPARPDDLTVTLSYDTPYAVIQHETLGFRHDPGRRAKWLELTLREQAAKALGYIAERMKRRLR